MRRQLVVTLVGISSLLWCCSGPRAPERDPGSALWVAPDSPEIGPLIQKQLSSHGIEELFVEVGELSWSGGTPLIESFEGVAETARSSRATLVIQGRWTQRDIEVSEVVDVLGAALDRCRMDATDHRLLALGFHFDLLIPGEEGAESLSAVIQGLRESFDPPLELSVRLPREASLGDHGWEGLVEAVDYFVAPVYGQRPGAADDPNRWDSNAILGRLDELDSWQRPYLGEVVTLGTATALGVRGAPRDPVTIGDLQSLAWNRSLVAGFGNALDRGVRQVYEFEAREATSAAFLTLKPSEKIRVVTTATPIVAELLERIEGSSSSYYRGALYYRLPRGGEEFGLSLPQLVNAHLGGQATRPALELDVQVTPRGGPRWALTLTLRNLSPEPTELSVLDANWVQVQLEDAFVNWVRPGHFPRYQTFQTGSDGELYVALRHADTFRLYVPLVRGEDELVAGPIEIRGWTDGNPRMLVGGAFITPYGGTLELPPVPWKQEETSVETEEM